MTTTTEQTALRSLTGDTEERLASLFFVIYRNARIVERVNPTFIRQCRTFYNLLTELLVDRDAIELKLIGGRLFIDHKLVRFDAATATNSADIIREWEAVGLAGVVFQSEVTIEHVEHLFLYLADIRPHGKELEDQSKELKKIGLPTIQLLSASEVAPEAPSVSEEFRRQIRTSARTKFFNAMAVVEENVTHIGAGRDVDVARTKRVVRSLIDHITQDDQSMLELAAIKDFDDYTYAHSTNVCVYSLTLSVRLGLDRPRLSQVGFAALFHDIGKVRLPADLIRKPDAFDENDWIQMQQHPQLGAKTILRNLKLDLHTARAARAAFEHHINADFTGYPVLHHDKRITNLFSKIVSITDTFDALTSGRVYIKKSFTPDQVLKKMHYQLKKKFDPFLLKIFTNIIGTYPAGTLVLLSTDEVALVLTNNETQWDRPYVKIVGNRQGLLPEPEWADLTRPEHEQRRIVRMIEPERYGLDLKQLILAD